jgi:hypothetical protein
LIVKTRRYFQKNKKPTQPLSGVGQKILLVDRFSALLSQTSALEPAGASWSLKPRREDVTSLTFFLKTSNFLLPTEPGNIFLPSPVRGHRGKPLSFDVSSFPYYN